MFPNCAASILVESHSNPPTDFSRFTNKCQSTRTKQIHTDSRMKWTKAQHTHGLCDGPQCRKKGRVPIRKPGRSGENMDLGSGGGVWGAISIAIFIERVTQKLRRIILLHSGLVTFRNNFGKPQYPLFYVSRVGGRIHGPTKQLKRNPGNTRSFLKDITGGHFKNLELRHFEKLGQGEPTKNNT